MLDAASSANMAVTVGSSTSIPSLASDHAAVNVAVALLEANTRPPSSINVDVTATAITMAANVANIAGDACNDLAANVDGDPSPAVLGNGADNMTTTTMIQSQSWMAY